MAFTKYECISSFRKSEIIFDKSSQKIIGFIKIFPKDFVSKFISNISFIISNSSFSFFKRKENGYFRLSVGKILEYFAYFSRKYMVLALYI